MKNVLILLAVFGLGVYVGKPVEIKLEMPEIKCIDIEVDRAKKPKAWTAPGGSINAALEQVAPAPSPSPSPSVLPAEAPVAEEKKEEHAFKSDDNEETTCDKWVKEKVKEVARWLGKYDQTDQKVTLATDEYPCLPQLRLALDAANIQVIEEGRVTVGDYVYYIITRAK